MAAPFLRVQLEKVTPPMPELPEVETVKRGMAPAIEGRRIVAADIRRPDLRWPFPKDMAVRLTGQRVLGLRRRSKYILADLSSGETLLIHLGMSGRVTVSGKAPGIFVHDHAAAAKHDHVVLEFEGDVRITYNDPRRFGAMDLLDTATAEAHPLLANIGPEPLGNSFNAAHLSKVFVGKKTAIKTALLDQRVVAGLGNIYVCEALHEARISPKRAAGAVSKARLDRLVPIVREVLLRAIEAGGSSLRDHRQASGELGYFQHQFRAYGQEGAPCPSDGCRGKIRRDVQAGRSTFWCSSCQR